MKAVSVTALFSARGPSLSSLLHGRHLRRRGVLANDRFRTARGPDGQGLSTGYEPV
jgi:hypothetical protein